MLIFFQSNFNPPRKRVLMTQMSCPFDPLSKIMKAFGIQTLVLAMMFPLSNKFLQSGIGNYYGLLIEEWRFRIQTIMAHITKKTKEATRMVRVN